MASWSAWDNPHTSSGTAAVQHRKIGRANAVDGNAFAARDGGDPVAA
jgi:hypothetical protein